MCGWRRRNAEARVSLLLMVSENVVKLRLCIPDAMHTNAYSATAAYLDSRVSLR